MEDNSIPESEVNWLYGIDDKYKIYMKNGISSVYPIEILPPRLKQFVKEKSLSTEYINMGPAVGCSEGMIWTIWGWNSIPNESSSENADWSAYIMALAEPSSISSIQKKLKNIQSELDEVNKLLTRYDNNRKK